MENSAWEERWGGVSGTAKFVCSVMKNNHTLSMSLLLLLINITHCLCLTESSRKDNTSKRHQGDT